MYGGDLAGAPGKRRDHLLFQMPGWIPKGKTVAEGLSAVWKVSEGIPSEKVAAHRVRRPAKGIVGNGADRRKRSVRSLVLV